MSYHQLLLTSQTWGMVFGWRFLNFAFKTWNKCLIHHFFCNARSPLIWNSFHSFPTKFTPSIYLYFLKFLLNHINLHSNIIMGHSFLSILLFTWFPFSIIHSKSMTYCTQLCEQKVLCRIIALIVFLYKSTWIFNFYILYNVLIIIFTNYFSSFPLK